LDAKQQIHLLHWLDLINERLQVQVVSTTSEPLFPLVQTGAFLADLYYKLNIVLIDLMGAGRHM
jgi:transcriptional regulator of acetoin/glycerol metabolism